MAERPLEGRRIVVTRPEAQARLLAEALEGLGAGVLVVPLVGTEPLASSAELDDALADLTRFDWVIFTSANAVRAVRDRLRGRLDGIRVAAVGPETAEAVRTLGAEPSFVPDRFGGEALATGLGELRGARILLPQADIADPGLAAELGRRGASVDAVVAYRTVEIEHPRDELEALRASDAVVLMSGSAARSLASQGGPGRALVACIGPNTAEIAREHGLEVGLVAREATSEGIIEALVAHFQEL